MGRSGLVAEEEYKRGYYYSDELWGELMFKPHRTSCASMRTCTSKNGKRVTEGAYSFAWDKERAGEGVGEDETRNQRKNNNALPDSFLYENLEAR